MNDGAASRRGIMSMTFEYTYGCYEYEIRKNCGCQRRKLNFKWLRGERTILLPSSVCMCALGICSICLDTLGAVRACERFREGNKKKMTKHKVVHVCAQIAI